MSAVWGPKAFALKKVVLTVMMSSKYPCPCTAALSTDTATPPTQPAKWRLGRVFVEASLMGAWIAACHGQSYFAGATALEGLKAVATIDAMYRSAKSGKAEMVSDACA